MGPVSLGGSRRGTRSSIERGLGRHPGARRGRGSASWAPASEEFAASRRLRALDARISPTSGRTRTLRRRSGTGSRSAAPMSCARRTSLVGPHRDDLELAVRDLGARSFGSHGETWAAALCLRLGLAGAVAARDRRTAAPAGGRPVQRARPAAARPDRGTPFASRGGQVFISVADEADVPAAMPRPCWRARRASSHRGGREPMPHSKGFERRKDDRSGDPVPIGAVVDALMAEEVFARGMPVAELARRGPRLVGERLAAESAPHRAGGRRAHARRHQRPWGAGAIPARGDPPQGRPRPRRRQGAPSDHRWAPVPGSR